MNAIVWITGAAVAVEGIVFLIYPAAMKKILIFFNKGKMLYAPCGIKLVLGILFLIYAKSCNIPWIIILLGLLMCAGGLGGFWAIDKIKKLTTWLETSPVMIRIWAAAAVILGGIILYAGTPAK